VLKVTQTLVVTALGVGFLGFTAKATDLERCAMSLTAEHERLTLDVGTWDATVRCYMQGPGSEPSISHGTEIVELLPGGLWALSDFEGQFGDASFHGHGQSGYDPLKKKYIGTWIDSMSPSIMTMEGDYDPKTKTLTMYGKGTDPRSGKPYEAKMTTEHKDKDSRVFAMFRKSDDSKGQFVKAMEISYARRAK
jgi:hypothetical protein